MSDDGQSRSKGVQSVEVGMMILKAFCETNRPMSLSEVAQRVAIPPAKAHRYLVSLIESGMVVHRKTGSYDLGRGAAEVGMAAVARFDVVNRAADMLPDVVETTGCTAMLSVWGTLGPTVVRWERSSPPLVTALGVGTLLPLLTSATGLALLAWSPERLAGERFLTKKEQKRAVTLCAGIRKAGLAEARQSFIPGLYALAAPVLDLQGRAEAVVTLVSTDKALLAEDSIGRRALKESFPTDRLAVPGGTSVAGT